MQEMVANRALDMLGGSGPSSKGNLKNNFDNFEGSNPKFDKEAFLSKFKDQQDVADTIDHLETKLNLFASLYMALPLASKSITFGAVSGNSAQPAIGATQSLTTLNTKNLSESNLVEGNTAEINLFASMEHNNRLASSEIGNGAPDRQSQILKINDSSWKSSLGRSLLGCISSNCNELELVVLPKTLGKINIQLATSGDTINIRIGTDNPNTAVVLNSALSDIEKFLSEGGIKLLSTGIGSGGSQHNNDKKSSDLSSVGSRERKNGEHEDIATSATKVKSKLGTHPGNYDYEV
jgi:flagellar hook-length control protein FliK